MRRRAAALAVTAVIGIAGGTASRLLRRRSPAEPPPSVQDPAPSGQDPSGPAPIQVLDVGIRTPPPQPVPLGLAARVVLSPLALLAAAVRLRRRLGLDRRERPGG